jgi:hypothetical protein
VKVERLGWIVQTGGKVAGPFIGLADRQLVSHLERLKALGLVFRHETGGQASIPLTRSSVILTQFSYAVCWRRSRNSFTSPCALSWCPAWKRSRTHRRYG